MTTCPHCDGSGRDYDCWDEKTCPMVADGGCADCSIRCPLCKGTGAALPTRCDIEVSALREGSRRAPR